MLRIKLTTFFLSIFLLSSSAFSQVIDVSSTNKDLEAAKALFDAKKYREAMGKYSTIIEEAMRSVPEAYYFRALCRINLRQVDGLCSDLQTAFYLDYDKALVYMIKYCDASRELKNNKMQASEHFWNGDYFKALENINSSLDININNIYILELRASTHKNIGDYEQAIKDFEELIVLDPKEKEYYQKNIDEIKSIKDDPEAALEFYTEIVQDEPGAKFAYALRGDVLNSLEMYDDALFDYDYAIELAPETGLFYYKRGVLLKKMDKLKKACPDLRKAKELGYKSEDLESQIQGCK